MVDSSYIKGRLNGLNELVKVLKEIVERKEEIKTQEIIQLITLHISAQMAAITQELSEAASNAPAEHANKLNEIKQKQEEKQKDSDEKPEAPVEKKVEEHGKSVDDLLKDLETLRDDS